MDIRWLELIARALPFEALLRPRSGALSNQKGRS